MNKEEFIKYHKVDHLGFQKYIESIGFIFSSIYVEYRNDKSFMYEYYEYKIFKIDLHDYFYNFCNGSEWFYDIDLSNLKPLHKEFNQELRSIKLKQILR